MLLAYLRSEMHIIMCMSSQQTNHQVNQDSGSRLSFKLIITLSINEQPKLNPIYDHCKQAQSSLIDTKAWLYGFEKILIYP